MLFENKKKKKDVCKQCYNDKDDAKCKQCMRKVLNKISIILKDAGYILKDKHVKFNEKELVSIWKVLSANRDVSNVYIDYKVYCSKPELKRFIHLNSTTIPLKSMNIHYYDDKCKEMATTSLKRRSTSSSLKRKSTLKKSSTSSSLKSGSTISNRSSSKSSSNSSLKRKSTIK